MAKLKGRSEEEQNPQDHNGDGKVSKKEKLDQDGDGKVSKKEKQDVNGDGRVSHSEKEGLTVKQAGQDTVKKAKKTMAKNLTKGVRSDLKKRAVEKTADKGADIAVEKMGLSQEGFFGFIGKGAHGVAKGVIEGGINTGLAMASLALKGLKLVSLWMLLATGRIRKFAKSLFVSMAGTALGSVGTTVVLGVTGVGAAGGAAGAAIFINEQIEIARRDEDPDDECVVDEEKFNTESGPIGDSDELSREEKIEVVKKIYSVASEWGLSQEHVAGMVSNFDVESGINAGLYETYHMDDKAERTRKREIADKDGPTTENMFKGGWGEFEARYAGISLEQTAYQAPERSGPPHYLGAGLGQWTGIGSKALWNFAKDIKKSMWDLETQLIFMFSNVEGSYYDRMERYRDQKFSNPADAGQWFLKNWEINVAGLGAPERINGANSWMVEIKKMNADKSYAKSILAQTKDSVSQNNASKASKDKQMGDCVSDDDKKSKAKNAGYLFDDTYEIDRSYGQYQVGGTHLGVDIRAHKGEGSTIFSPVDGTVVYNINDGWAGPGGPSNDMTIQVEGEDDSYKYLVFAHLVHNSGMHLKVGDKVAMGDEIGKMGNTGMSTGPHLHFELSDLTYSGYPDLSHSKNPGAYLKGVENAEKEVENTNGENMGKAPIQVDPSKDGGVNSKK